MIRVVLALGALLVPAVALAGVDDENAKDMRCLIVASEMAESEDKEIETAGLIASQYYLGRIDGRTPNADLEKLLVQEAIKLGDAQRPELMMSCAKHIEDRGKAMEKVGASIEAAAGE